MAPPRALSEFVAEANEVLETLAHDVAVLDAHRGREPEPELLNAIFRAAHSLKWARVSRGRDALFAPVRTGVCNCVSEKRARLRASSGTPASRSSNPVIRRRCSRCSPRR